MILISNMTNLQPKIALKRHFWHWFVLQEFLRFDEIKDADFKYDNRSFKFQSKNNHQEHY